MMNRLNENMELSRRQLGVIWVKHMQGELMVSDPRQIYRFENASIKMAYEYIEDYYVIKYDALYYCFDAIMHGRMDYAQRFIDIVCKRDQEITKNDFGMLKSLRAEFYQQLREE